MGGSAGWEPCPGSRLSGGECYDPDCESCNDERWLCAQRPKKAMDWAALSWERRREEELGPGRAVCTLERQGWASLLPLEPYQEAQERLASEHSRQLISPQQPSPGRPTQTLQAPGSHKEQKPWGNLAWGPPPRPQAQASQSPRLLLRVGEGEDADHSLLCEERQRRARGPVPVCVCAGTGRTQGYEAPLPHVTPRWGPTCLASSLGLGSWLARHTLPPLHVHGE